MSSSTKQELSACAGDSSEPRLQITEIYLSLQGESTYSGLPCTFIRLTGCPLRCTYCDTAYAFYGGEKISISAILSKIAEIGCSLVEVTGGEPLAQPNCIHLLERLVRHNRTVLLETSGAFSTAAVPPDVRKILDIKTPSSGEQHRNLFDNLDLLAPHDEVKFVLGSREDYDWAREIIKKYELPRRCNAVLLSCVFTQLEPAVLADWMISDKLFDVRMQLQAHKYIWDPAMKGV
jgi:7-carboxy-7-deazaguanine synthase